MSYENSQLKPSLEKVLWSADKDMPVTVDIYDRGRLYFTMPDLIVRDILMGGGVFDKGFLGMSIIKITKKGTEQAHIHCEETVKGHS